MPPRWFPRETRTAPQVIRLRMAPQNREGLPVMIEIACGIGGGLRPLAQHVEGMPEALRLEGGGMLQALFYRTAHDELAAHQMHGRRSEEPTSELQSLMRNSYAVFCWKKKTKKTNTTQEKR